MELTYENMMAVVKKYCDLLPGLTPENKHEMEAICTPDYVSSYPGGQTEADHVSEHWETYRAHLYYEPWPLYIIVDDRKKMAATLFREEAKHPMTGELVKELGRDPVTFVPTRTLDTIYLRQVFELTLHDNQVKIKTVFSSRIDTDSVEWQRWRDLSKHQREGIEKELTYENMMAVVKKYCDMLLGLTPETKHEMEAICTPDCVYSYPDGQTEADHVSSHWEIYRAYLYYEPWPLCIIVDDRKKMVDCVLKEEARHPVTGELVKTIRNEVTGELEDTIYMREVFELTLHDNQVKIKNIFMSDIDTNSVAWQRWRDLAKH